MIDFTQKTWVDYPDTNTPIMAAELNRMEDGISAACNGVNAAPTAEGITQFIISSINALHPEYTVSTFSETVETESDKTMTCMVNMDVYNPDKYDGLLITADGVLISPLAYTTAVENDAAVIRLGTSAGLKLGQTVDFTVYHKPQGGGVSAGQAILLATGTNDSIAGIAETEEV